MSKSTGYIINGKYVRASSVPSGALAPRKQVLHKQFEAERDRQEFARDLVQPYLPNGKPNPEFITALPKEAERYGFVNKDENNAVRRRK
jgi:hypothetical protein